MKFFQSSCKLGLYSSFILLEPIMGAIFGLYGCSEDPRAIISGRNTLLSLIFRYLYVFCQPKTSLYRVTPYIKKFYGRSLTR